MAREPSLLGTDHPSFYPIRTLRWELEALEAQMLAVWRTRAAQLQEDQDPEPLLDHRLRKLGKERRQTRAAIEKLRGAL